MQYVTESELAKLIESVEQEFTAHLNKAEVLAKSEASGTALAKADESAPPKKDKKDEKPAEKEAAPEKKEAAPAAPAEKEAAPAAPAPAEGEAAPPQAEAAPAMGEEQCDYDDEDMAHMQKMYESMSKAELMKHHDAVRMALDAKSAAPAAAAPAAAAPAAPAAPIEKSEIKDENPVLNSKPTDKGSHISTEYEKNSGGAVAATGEPHGSPGAKSPASKDQRNLSNMEKSEQSQGADLLKTELEAEKAKSAELKKSLDTAQEFLAKLATKIVAPKGKAITELSVIAKSEGAQETVEMSKAEVTAKLLQKSADPSLSKSDRDAINAFYLSKANFNTISHLLK